MFISRPRSSNSNCLFLCCCPYQLLLNEVHINCIPPAHFVPEYVGLWGPWRPKYTGISAVGLQVPNANLPQADGATVFIHSTRISNGKLNKSIEIGIGE